MDEQARAGNLELLKRCLTQTFARGEGRRRGRLRPTASPVMQPIEAIDWTGAPW